MARRSEEETARRRCDTLPVSPKPSIYTIRSTVIYEWPSENIESRCKESNKPEHRTRVRIERKMVEG